MRLLLLPVLLVLAGWVLSESDAQADKDTVRAVHDRDFHDAGAPPAERVELGRLLFFDKILSGNKNISCATCHHPSLATADALPLGLGEGAAGLGKERRAGLAASTALHERVPRNAPALFNIGAKEFQVMFHDGRVEVDTKGHYESGFISPAKFKLPAGLANVLAAQAMFPVTSQAEMAGQKGENEIANAVTLAKAAGPDGAWALLAKRLQAVPTYVEHFKRAFPEDVREAKDISYVHAANAIAAFEATAFRSDNSPYDRYLRGEAQLAPAARRGLALFEGKARCSVCHSGPFQTDHAFHAIAMPQIGPGKADGRDASYWNKTGSQAFVEDFGRGRVTWNKEDRYRFRTPSLRNVRLTAPYGHSGAYATLEEVVRHHLDPVGALERYEVPERFLPELPAVLELKGDARGLRHERLGEERHKAFLARDSWVQKDARLRKRLAEANELRPVALTEAEFEDLIAFLDSLTDPRVLKLQHLVPARVPSGLPVED